MKDLHTGLNKKRPDFIGEIIVVGYEHRGLPPYINDIKHLTPILCENKDHESIVDVVFQLQGEIEIKLETMVKLEWPKIKIPVFLAITIKSLTAKCRYHYNSMDPDKCYLQWLGKPRMQIELIPVLGSDFNIKNMSTSLISKLQDWVSNQLIAFEKEKIEIPLTETPVFIPRYDSIFIKTETKSKSSQANIKRGKTNKDIIRTNSKILKSPVKT